MKLSNTSVHKVKSYPEKCYIRHSLNNWIKANSIKRLPHKGLFLFFMLELTKQSKLKRNDLKSVKRLFFITQQETLWKYEQARRSIAKFLINKWLSNYGIKFSVFCFKPTIKFIFLQGDSIFIIFRWLWKVRSG